MLAADANVVQKLVDLAAPTQFTIKDALGRDSTYTSKPVHEIKAAAPAQPSLVEVHTLAGFADLVRQKLDAEKAGAENFLIHVEDQTTVTLKYKTTDDYGRRLVLIMATPVPFEQFTFGEYLEQDEFIIAVNSKFADTDDKKYVLQVASTLTQESVKISNDNGIAQVATLKQGMKLADEVEVKPIVSLAPFRTFPECQQVISKFVFRIEGGQEPSLMLTEADGGRWKVDAINEVRRVISTFTDLALPVIA